MADLRAVTSRVGPIVTRLKRVLRHWADRLFPDRQIFLRTHGEVRFIEMSQRRQIALAGGAAFALVWLLISSALVLWNGAIIADQNQRLEAMATAYDQLSANMRDNQAQLFATTEMLEGKHQDLSSLMSQRLALKQALSNISKALAEASQERDDALGEQAELRAELNNLERRLRNALGERSELARSLTATENSLYNSLHAVDQSWHSGLALAAQVKQLQQMLTGLEDRKAALERSLASTELIVDVIARERDEARNDHDAMQSRVDELEDRLGDLRRSQIALIRRIAEQTDTNINGLESVIRTTGLNIDHMLRRMTVEEEGVGGPLIETPDLAHSGDEFDGLAAEPKPRRDKKGFAGRLARLEGRLERWSTLNQVLGQLPLTTPVDHFHVSSRFGKRRDPFTKRWAVHEGIDLSGPPRAPIYATAPGEVTFVGWKGSFGRLVEIRHGNGVTTRYGHLRKILVKKGQQVAFREKIGLMGTSGRSTGTHVHYEIRYDGAPLDPAKFIKAGRYVFKDGKD